MLFFSEPTCLSTFSLSHLCFLPSPRAPLLSALSSCLIGCCCGGGGGDVLLPPHTLEPPAVHHLRPVFVILSSSATFHVGLSTCPSARVWFVLSLLSSLFSSSSS